MTRYCIIVSSTIFTYYIPKLFVELADNCDLQFWTWIGNFAETKKFFVCAKGAMKKAGSEKCFDCLCVISDITSIIGLEFPCCHGNKECGRKKQISNYIKKYLVEY